MPDTLEFDEHMTLSGYFTPLVAGPVSELLQITPYAGIKGESHIAFGPNGFDLACIYTISNIANEYQLNNLLRNIANQIGLHGTVTQNNSTWEKCTFRGFSEFPDARFYDGSGNHGWVTQGVLLWRCQEIPDQIPEP